jgi:hypothetical protein
LDGLSAQLIDFHVHGGTEEGVNGIASNGVPGVFVLCVVWCFVEFGESSMKMTWFMTVVREERRLGSSSWLCRDMGDLTFQHRSRLPLSYVRDKSIRLDKTAALVFLFDGIRASPFLVSR